MVRTSTNLPNTSLRREDTPQWRAPLGSYADIAMSDTRASQRKPISRFIVPPRAQASRRCQTQAPLGGKAPSFASVSDPGPHSARSGNLIVGDGMKNGLPAPNKELAINRKQPLDRESPIQVRIHLPPAGSLCLAGFLLLVSKSRQLPRRVRARPGGTAGRDAQGS